MFLQFILLFLNKCSLSLKNPKNFFLAMKVLLIFNKQPYDGTDVCWNGLRLAHTLLAKDNEVRIFLMNDAVDIARVDCVPPAESEENLTDLLKDLIKIGAEVKVCGSCFDRCGLHKGKPFFDESIASTMGQLAEWITDSDRVLNL